MGCIKSCIAIMTLWNFFLLILELAATEDASGDSQSSLSVVAIVLGALGCLLLLTIIILFSFYIIATKKLLPVFREQNMSGGIGKLYV